MRLKKGDNVMIMRGKDRGKSGKITNVNSVAGRVSIEGINVYKKHVRPKKQGEKGEIVSLLRPMSASNVMIVCEHCKQPARIGYQLLAPESGSKSKALKTRYCKKCNGAL